MRPDRSRLLAQYHLGAKTLYQDDDTRRAALALTTGHRSAADCTDADLRRMIAVMREAGAYDGMARGGRGPDRPTPAQWNTLARLARARGWRGGLEDRRTQEFAQRITGLASTRMATRAQISQVITGLERWAAQDAAAAAP